jgi:hypothetical protein
MGCHASRGHKQVGIGGTKDGEKDHQTRWKQQLSWIAQHQNISEYHHLHTIEQAHKFQPDAPTGCGCVHPFCEVAHQAWMRDRTFGAVASAVHDPKPAPL